MKINGYTIRLEKPEEQRDVEILVRESFWNVYRPGCYEHFLLHILRDYVDFVPELNYVLEIDGRIAGQIVFVRSSIHTDDGKTIPTLTMGPICIASSWKRQGFGKRLLDFAFQQAKEMGFGAVCFEGNIDFYGKCGCVPASQYGIRYHGLPQGEDASFFLCRVLKDGYLDGIRGEYTVPSVYDVTEEAVEVFDSAFPKKEKKRLPTQLF